MCVIVKLLPSRREIDTIGELAGLVGRDAIVSSTPLHSLSLEQCLCNIDLKRTAINAKYNHVEDLNIWPWGVIWKQTT